MRITRLKSQVGIETIMLIIILLLMFVILLLFGIKRQQDSNDIKDYIEKRRECLRLSDIVSSVSNSKSGSTVKTSTDYAVIFYNDSITIKNVENVTVQETKIAVLVSEAGESTQNFYDSLTARLSPKWYKVCFDDIPGGGDIGCQQWQTPGITVSTWDSITKTLDDLVKEIDNYTVIYLEDAHIQYNAVYNGKTYRQILQDWVSEGNILIMAEHPMCREQNSGVFSQTSFQCNPPGVFNNDEWQIFGNNITQRSGTYGNDVTVIINPPDEYFPNMDLGDKYDFEENSYIKILTNPYKQAYVGILTGTYSSSGGSYSDTFSDNNAYWYVGSTSSSYNISAYAELTFNISNLTIQKEDIQDINFSIKYCHDGSGSVPAACDGDAAEGTAQGNQDVEIYNYSGSVWQSIGTLRTNDNGNEVFSSYTASGNLSDFVSSTKLIRARYKVAYYNYNNQDSFLVIDAASINISARNLKEPTIVAKYDADLLPAVIYWDYGQGKAFYFGDFQVATGQSDYSEMLSELIERVYYLLITPKTSELSCTYMGSIATIGQFTGNIEIKNSGERVYIIQK